MYKMKMVGMILLAVVLSFSISCVEKSLMTHEIESENGFTKQVPDQWRFGMQAYTFRRFTFYEAVDKTAALGLDWIEAYPGQQLSKERAGVKFDHTMSAQIRQEIKEKLAQAGVKLVNYGCVDLPNDEVKCRQVFDFARNMGVETIVSEPPQDAFDLIDRLCIEYKIKVAIHNHPKRKTSRYWNPDSVLAACEGRSKWIGVCADTGHWVRSGIDPIQSLKKLEGRLISFHLKDVERADFTRAHDVVWGKGKGDISEVLKEIHRQNFEGTIIIEYELHSEKLMSELQQCVEYFNKVAAKL